MEPRLLDTFDFLAETFSFYLLKEKLFHHDLNPMRDMLKVYVLLVIKSLMLHLWLGVLQWFYCPLSSQRDKLHVCGVPSMCGIIKVNVDFSLLASLEKGSILGGGWGRGSYVMQIEGSCSLSKEKCFSYHLVMKFSIENGMSKV